LNDHHFHWAYFIKAAAIIGMYDIKWAHKWKPFVELLIRDVNNWDVNDKRFPLHRQFDNLVGHHYSSGHAGFASGNNQESSSEAMNFNSAVVMWAMQVGNTEARDVGIYLYASETAAIEEYWFNVGDDVYPEEIYDAPIASLVWDDGASYEIFWGPPTPEEVHGINMLPIVPSSMYLARQASRIPLYNNYMYQMKGGNKDLTRWHDVIWSYTAFADPEQALSEYRSHPNYPVEDGSSRAHTLYFINSMKNLGRMSTNVHADFPTALYFVNGYYVVWNPTASTVTVQFSDGASFTVKPRQTFYSHKANAADVIVSDANRLVVQDAY
jgi:endoglucanase Acf2